MARRTVGVLHAALLFLGAGAWLLVGLSLATLFSVSVGSSLNNSEPLGHTVKCTIGMTGSSLACASRTGYGQIWQKGQKSPADADARASCLLKSVLLQLCPYLGFTGVSVTPCCARMASHIWHDPPAPVLWCAWLSPGGRA